MNTVLIILGVLLVAAGVYFYFYKQGKINDTDGDYIPDEIEDAVEDVKETAATIKRRAKAVKEEIVDVLEEARDVTDALKGKVTKSKLRSMITLKMILEKS
jgi:F0F1-type ATP synthase membrane subunit b/b'